VRQKTWQQKPGCVTLVVRIEATSQQSAWRTIPRTSCCSDDIHYSNTEKLSILRAVNRPIGEGQLSIRAACQQMQICTKAILQVALGPRIKSNSMHGRTQRQRVVTLVPIWVYNILRKSFLTLFSVSPFLPPLHLLNRLNNAQINAWLCFSFD
jgi:hypothetical protein